MSRLKFSNFRAPFTLIIAGLCVLAYFTVDSFIVFEWQNWPNFWFLSPIYFLLASLLHTDGFHLTVNLIIWIVLGFEFERKYGTSKLVLVYVAAVLLGGFVETIRANLDFVGLSAACFGVFSALLFNQKLTNSRLNTCVIATSLIFGLIILEAALTGWQNSTVAWGAHLGGAMAGFFSSLGLGKRHATPGFRPMREDDIAPILDIIYDFDEDDGEEAENSFRESLANKFVVEHNGQPIAMTGITVDDQAQNVAWLSWTYVHPDFQRQGIAFSMMQDVRDLLEQMGVRKVFISTSDYKDEDDGSDVYGPARRFYEHKLHAKREIVIQDYYDKDESQYVYSLPVIDYQSDPVEVDKGFHPVFVSIEQGDESETGYVVGWEETQMPQDQTANLTGLIDQARSRGAHALFVSLPSHLSYNGARDLTEAGFSMIGRLTDFYAPGVDDMYWAYYFGDV